MSCLTCLHSTALDRKDARRSEILKAMAARGFLACNASDFRATFRPFAGSCERFAQADEKTVEARVKWAKPATPPQPGQSKR